MERIAIKGDDFAITCHRPTLSLTGCAIDWIEYSLWTLFSLVTSESAFIHMLCCLRTDIVSDWFCRWRQRVFTLHL